MSDARQDVIRLAEAISSLGAVDLETIARKLRDPVLEMKRDITDFLREKRCQFVDSTDSRRTHRVCIHKGVEVYGQTFFVYSLMSEILYGDEDFVMCTEWLKERVLAYAGSTELVAAFVFIEPMRDNLGNTLMGIECGVTLFRDEDAYKRAHPDCHLFDSTHQNPEPIAFTLSEMDRFAEMQEKKRSGVA